MEIRTDIKNIIFQYADVKIGIEHELRENYLRFQRNVEKIFGLKVGMDEYNKLCGVLALNHACEQRLMLDNTFRVTEYEYKSSRIPRIYITLHLGCYEEIAYYLINREGKICVPVTERVYMCETEHYHINLGKRGITPSQLVFVNIESTTGLRQMIRYAKSGYSLLCYIDGNSGIGGMARSDFKLERIHFFNTTLHVRKGIEYIARILNREVVPIYTYIEDTSFQLKIVLMPPVEKTPWHSLTAILWQSFLHCIWKYYWQWEAWLYVDEFIEQATSKDFKESRYIVNTDRYLPLIKSDIHYYYDRNTNKLVKVGRRLFRLLSNLESSPIYSYSELIEYIPKENLVNDILAKKLIIKK